MHTAAHQFEEGLRALMDGGTLTYAGTTVSVPRATDRAFRTALEEVAATWEPLHRASHAVMENEPQLDLILDEVQAYLQVEFGAIHLVQGREVILRCWRGLSDAFHAHVLSFPADDPPAYFLKARIVHERLSEEGLTPDFAKREGIQAWACLPLRLPSPQEGEEGEWLGAILVGSRRYKALGEDQVQALKAMADQLALAIDHARAYWRAQERLARLQTLRDIDRAIIQQLDLWEVLYVVLERVPRELGADAAAISLFNAKTFQGEVFAMRLPRGRIEYVTPAFERVTGYSEEETVGETPRILQSGLMEREYYHRRPQPADGRLGRGHRTGAGLQRR